jgi:hypothetical protein
MFSYSMAEPQFSGSMCATRFQFRAQVNWKGTLIHSLLFLNCTESLYIEVYLLLVSIIFKFIILKEHVSQDLMTIVRSAEAFRRLRLQNPSKYEPIEV